MAQKIVKVKSGDTLSKIAKASGVTVSALASANKIKDVNKIFAGQTISIPGITTSSSKTNVSSAKQTNGKSSGTKYNQYSMSKPLTGTISSAPKKTKVGSFLSKIGKTFKDSLQGSAANSGYATNPFTYNDGLLTDVEKEKPLTALAEDISTGYNTAISNIDELKRILKADAKPTFAEEPTYNSQNIPLLETPGGNPDITGTGGLAEILNGSSTTEEPVVEKTVSNTITEPTVSESSSSSVAAPVIPNVGNAVNTVLNNFGVRSDIKPNAWEEGLKGKGEFQDGEVLTISSKVADIFNGDYNAAFNYLNSPEGKQNLKPFTDKGGNIEDILKKVTPATTGVTAPQTFEQFQNNLKNLDASSQQQFSDYMASKTTGVTPITTNTKNIPSELKGIVDAQNKEMIMQSQNISDYQKMLYQSAYTDMIVASEEIKQSEQLINDRRTAIEEKTKLQTRKLKAEMREQEAESEQARINSMNYMRGYLGQIGALDTSGNAALGLENLEQKYQSQKQGIRNKYMFAIDELETESDEKISELQYNLQKDKLEAYKDLNKSDREIRMKMFELESDYKSKALSNNTKYQEKLSDMRIKYSNDSKELASKEKEWAIKFIAGGYNPETSKAMAKDLVGNKTTDKTMMAVAGLGTKENEYKFAKDEQSQLLKAGETADSIAMIQNDISKYGIDTVYNDSGLDKQTRKALKTIFGL